MIMKTPPQRTLCFLLICLFSTATLADEGWQAGAAATKITPAKPMWMAGYASRDRPADETLHDLWAKVLVLQDADGDRGILLTLDLVGIGRDVTVPICDAITKRFDVARQDIAICTSHTHSGPVVGSNLAPMHYAIVPESQQRQIEQYADRLQQQVIELVANAIKDLQPCRLQRASGVATFAVNRRNNPAAEVPTRRSTGAWPDRSITMYRCWRSKTPLAS